MDVMLGHTFFSRPLNGSSTACCKNGASSSSMAMTEASRQSLLTGLKVGFPVVRMAQVHSGQDKCSGANASVSTHADYWASYMLYVAALQARRKQAAVTW